MEYLLMTLLFLVALFLILLILIQRGRGGGLAGAFGGMGGQSAFGTKAGDLFTRITIGAAVVWILLCAASVKILSSNQVKVSQFGNTVSPDAAGKTIDGKDAKDGKGTAAGPTGPAKGDADKAGAAKDDAGKDATAGDRTKSSAASTEKPAAGDANAEAPEPADSK